MFTAIDNQILDWMIALRSPRMSAAAVEITALGAGSVLALFVTLVTALMISMRKTTPALQLLVTSLGAHYITRLLKNFIERDRPPMATRLVEVAGYSFPSGHSLAAAAVYLSLALLAIPLFNEKSQKWILGILAGILIFLVGASRIYLGVHYPTDVMAGISIGIAWAVFVNWGARRLPS